MFVGVFSLSPRQLENGRYLLALAVALIGSLGGGLWSKLLSFLNINISKNHS
jgi:hypothetical protein